MWLSSLLASSLSAVRNMDVLALAPSLSQMLPLLFELVWKSIGLVSFGLPHRFSGQTPETFSEDFNAISMGVILLLLFIPRSYVYRHYVQTVGNRWSR